MDDPAVQDVLRLAARVEIDRVGYDRLADATGRLKNWNELPPASEAHGLLPLLYFHLVNAGVSLPVDVRQRLFAAGIHHRDSNQARIHALREILDAFNASEIPAIVLKGAALAHILYPSIGLRPLSDIDLLVDASLAPRAQALLGEIGFNAPALPTVRHLTSHHHLPVATRRDDRHLIQVEIHVDALSRDTRASLSMKHLSAPARPFSLEGSTAYSFGHEDMLYHLCRHAAARGSLLRLIWVADAVGYATRYREEIAWAELRERYPFVVNALSLLHLVTPLPDELTRYVSPARGNGLRGVGVTCKPLHEIVKKDRSVGEIARDLFAPSEWWLRLHYGVGETSSLKWQRWVAHPMRVGRWFARRLLMYVRWWATRQQNA